MLDTTGFDESGIYRHDRHYLAPCETATRVGGKRTRTESIGRGEAIDALFAGKQMIYAIRMPDGIIKIGCTGNVRQRRNWLKGDILGLMPGDFSDELEIHHLLREHVHHGREWYNPTPAVLAVVNRMREPFGLEPLAA